MLGLVGYLSCYGLYVAHQMCPMRFMEGSRCWDCEREREREMTQTVGLLVI